MRGVFCICRYCGSGALLLPPTSCAESLVITMNNEAKTVSVSETPLRDALYLSNGCGGKGWLQAEAGYASYCA